MSEANSKKPESSSSCSFAADGERSDASAAKVLAVSPVAIAKLIFASNAYLEWVVGPLRRSEMSVLAIQLRDAIDEAKAQQAKCSK